MTDVQSLGTFLYLDTCLHRRFPLLLQVKQLFIKKTFKINVSEIWNKISEICNKNSSRMYFTYIRNKKNAYLSVERTFCCELQRQLQSPVILAVNVISKNHRVVLDELWTIKCTAYLQQAMHAIISICFLNLENHGILIYSCFLEIMFESDNGPQVFPRRLFRWDHGKYNKMKENIGHARWGRKYVKHK